MSGDPKISEGRVSLDMFSTLENVRSWGLSLTGVDVTIIVTSVSVLVEPDFIANVVLHSCLCLKGLKD